MGFARLAFRTLLTLLILLVLIGLLLPSSAEVERSIVIDAPPGKIFSHLNGMRAFHAWSPWSKIDPDTEYRFSGPEQGVGSRMTWQSGNAQVGRGSQEITASVPEQRVETRLVFGDQGNGSAVFMLEPEGNSTRIVWQFRTEFGSGSVQPLRRLDARHVDRHLIRQGPEGAQIPRREARGSGLTEHHQAIAHALHRRGRHRLTHVGHAGGCGQYSSSS